MFHRCIWLVLGCLTLGCTRARPQAAGEPDSTSACFDCHGQMENGNAAPPPGFSDDPSQPDAHQAHLKDASRHAPIPCGSCHGVPKDVFAPGHIDTSLPAEMTWGALAKTDGANPRLDAGRCTNVYCHGATLKGGGGSVTAPVWTRVDGSASRCDSCHGFPPGGTHVRRTDCASCHGMVVDASQNFVGPALHVNGQVDVIAPLECNSCHGSAARGSGPTSFAPPVDTSGDDDSTAVGVGAHPEHLRSSSWRAAIACEECHVVPATVDAPGHNDTRLPAELAFGTHARAQGAKPSFDGSRCNNVYCHGTTLTGANGSLTRPQWTLVNGSQAACGTCHGIAPPAPHPRASPTSCSPCHPFQGLLPLDPSRHVDGTVDLATGCTSCHGSPDEGPAPPPDTLGNPLESARGVGAHQSHLAPSTWRGPVVCADCHTVPSDVTHADGAVALPFGALSKTSGASPDWNGATCSGVYCHGATLGGGYNTTPTWTAVGQEQAKCGTCHGIPPPAPHPRASSTDCSRCHPFDGLVPQNPLRHVDGVVDVATSCTSCHGNPARVAPPETLAAPPDDTFGKSDPSLRSVGAHESHLASSNWRAPVRCNRCHPVPTAVNSPKHANGIVDLAPGDFAVWDSTTMKCSKTYCHGTWLSGGYNTTPTWTHVDQDEAACGACHGKPPSWPHPQLLSEDCSRCHPFNVLSPQDPGRHVNGVLDVATDCAACHGDPTRLPAEARAAPPRDTRGNDDTGGAVKPRGIGAHQSHLTPSLGAVVQCSECHSVPASNAHIDGRPDVKFGTLATTRGASSAMWDGAKCSNVYCHGATLEGGNNKTPSWTQVDGSQKLCGTCHGLPPANHPEAIAWHACDECHNGIVDGALNIIGPSVHINGVPNWYQCQDECH